MEKPVAAIELGSKKLKLVVGYEIDGQVYVIYAMTKPYNGDYESFDPNDLGPVSKTVESVKDFSDVALKIKMSINDALLSIPPLGLEIFDTKQTTSVISEEKKIANLDIRNLYAIIRNGASELKNELVSIIPDYYIMDQGRTSVNPPIGERSNSLTLCAKVHTLPGSVVKSFSNALENGGIHIRKSFISVHGAVEYIASFKDMPESYFLVDIGSSSTYISLVGNKHLICSRYFHWGGDNITNHIIQTFNISEFEAEKIKTIYGIDTREFNFNPPVCKAADGKKNPIKHYRDELNEIIRFELDNFVKSLNSGIETIIKDFNQNYNTLPMVFTGGGSLLKGLTDYVKPQTACKQIITFAPNSLGARNPTFVNCLGMILASSKSPNVYDDNHQKVGNISREVDK